MISFIALIAGIIFGFGIIGSGMVNPALVLAFLDVTGDWDATLLWVMGGAVTVGTIFYTGKKAPAILSWLTEADTWRG